ncbi:MAG TPA: hypothetical protein VHP81_08295, partial [Lachnospiraceae bacterium]|nr:hypothetical protein [Lachnospiraceae bacterium]
MKKVYDNSKVKSALLIIGTTIGVYLVFRYALFLFLPFILAYFAAKLILPIINWMYRKIRMPRMISATILIIILAGLLV